MSGNECTATRHNTWRAYREHGCKCPEIVARMRAARERWKPRESEAVPADEMAVVRRLGGDESIRLRRCEIPLAVAQVDQYGVSARQIAQRLGISPRTVERHRARRRAQVEQVAA